jgi:mitosis inhibitor protein kinase SWE1
VIATDWNLPPPRLSTEFSPSQNTTKVSPGRSASGSSGSPVATMNSPLIHPSTRRVRHLPISSGQRRSQGNHFSASETRRSSWPSAEDQPGRFARDFVEVDEVGSGEFGKVIKVRCRGGCEGEMFAVKKSKRFEGTRHR